MSEEQNRTSQQDESLTKQRLARLEAERDLAIKLAQAGARDVETAVLVAMARLATDETCDADCLIDELRRDKPYLFSREEKDILNEPPRRTGGPRQRRRDDAGALERAAKRAAGSGRRADLQDYLRLRRNSA